jgi:hemoglobin
MMSGAVLALALIAQTAATVEVASAEDAKPSLYKRLGGYDAIAAVSDDFIARLAGEPQFARFFGGHSTDSLKLLRQRVVDMVCQATGGPCIYTGRDMKTAHAGLAISQKDWDTAIGHLGATLDKFKVPKAEKDELIGILGPLKADIVEK